MQIQRCSAVNCNPAKNSNRNVNFKAVEIRGRDVFYKSGITPTLLDKNYAKLVRVFGTTDVTLFANSEKKEFGLMSHNASLNPENRPFEALSEKPFSKHIDELSSALAKLITITA